MDKWGILGLQPGADEDMIQDAYYEKLQVTNPEEDAQGFMQLRRAYEEAMREAKNRKEKGDSEAGAEEDMSKAWIYDDTPEGNLMKQVRQLYENFADRLCVDQWKALLEQPICMNLDSRQNICERILVFLLDHHYLPHAVYQCIDQCLNLTEGRREWKEKFPEDFLDYIENQIRYEDDFSYELFEPLTETDYEVYDSYISSYYEMVNLRKSGQTAEAAQVMQRLQEASVYHPFPELEKAFDLLGKLDIWNEEVQTREKKAKKPILSAELYREAEPIYQRYPNVSLVQMTYANACIYMDRETEAEAILEKVLEKEPNNAWAKRSKAECLRRRKAYLDAKELLIDVMQENSYDTAARALLIRCNEEIIEAEKKNPLQSCEDEEAYRRVLELGWANSQNANYDEARRVLKRWEFPEDSSYDLEKTYLTAYCCIHSGVTNKAEQMFTRYQELYEHLAPDLEGKTLKDAKRRFYLSHYYMGQLAMDREDYVSALAFNETAKNGRDENFPLYRMQEAEIYLKMGREEETLRICETMDGSKMADYYILYAKAEREAGQYQNALAHLQKSISQFPYIVEAYVMQMQIFLQFQEFEQAEEILKHCEEINMPMGAEIEVIRAMILDAKDKLREADKCCEKALRRWKKKPESFKQCGKSVVLYAGEMADIFRRQKKMECAQEILDMALVLYPQSVSLLYHKAYLLHAQGSEYQKVAPYLKKVLAIDYRHFRAHGLMGEILEHEANRTEDRDVYVDCTMEAIREYHTQCEIDDRAYYRTAAGLLLQNMGKLEEAQEDFSIAQKLEDKNPYAFYNYGTNRLFLDDENDALMYLTQAIDKLEEAGEKPSWTFYQALIACYCRMGNAVQALRCCDELLARNLFVLTVLSEKAEILRIFGRNMEAIEIHKESYAIAEEGYDQLFILADLAQCYESIKKETKQSIRFLKHALRKSEFQKYQIYRRLACEYMYYFEFKKAAKNFETVISLGDRSLATMSRYAYVSARIGAWDEVRKTLKSVEKKVEKAVEDYTERAEMLRYLCLLQIARSLLPENDKKKGLEEAMRIASLYEETPKCMLCKYKACFELIYVQGLVAKLQGNILLAEQCFEKAVLWGPYEPECHLALRTIRNTWKRRKI